ncbi:hypothetical protein BBW65_02435 [Helicobacter enhydrae]|uniref:Uncharacterized protein n=1 Tax=Helicobacter enhydrae TaxID=222136 RepID=A0A1B1U4R4_9HELI|nr:hypothetical protein [Helicobacter enhydrae]ANV97731.1 hypothetical protein BBW65_02435 [Helicobacter enhydrae]
MTDNIQSLLASVATYKVFLNKRKQQDEILFIFCQQVICEYFLAKPFNLGELNKKIQDTFGLDIPIFALQDAIQRKGKKFIKRDETGYKVVNNEIKSTSIELEETRKSYCNFLKEISPLKNDRNFDKNLYSFLLEGNKDNNKIDREWLLDFSKILEEHKNFKENIEIMKQGLILYEGLSNKIDAKRNNREKIILFLDTEILFHAAGYNKGEYKKIFDAFFKLVKKYGYLLLPLHYTDIVEKEVRDIFEAAKYHKKNKNLNYIPTSVMEYLMSNFEDDGAIETE